MPGYLFDVEAERLDTAIRLIWKLYMRERWGQLNRLGLTQDEHGYALDAAIDVLAGRRGIGAKLSDWQVSRLVRVCPFVLAAALQMHWRYLAETGPTRAVYYGITDGIEG